jgi:translation initiation factor IF-1
MLSCTRQRDEAPPTARSTPNAPAFACRGTPPKARCLWLFRRCSYYEVSSFSCYRGLVGCFSPRDGVAKGAAIPEKEAKIELQGEVVEAYRNGVFKIALDNGHSTLGYTSGKMRRFRIRINPGDRITVELSPYDLERGRIVYRER